jgi:hypothetical protein
MTVLIQCVEHPNDVFVFGLIGKVYGIRKKSLVSRMRYISAKRICNFKISPGSNTRTPVEKGKGGEISGHEMEEEGKIEG